MAHDAMRPIRLFQVGDLFLGVVGVAAASTVTGHWRVPN